MGHRLFVNVLLAGVCAAAMSAPALAQTTPATPPTGVDAGQTDTSTPGTPLTNTEEDTTPADIVVTAQNRSQRVQDVPIAISVVSGDALKQQGVTDFSSVQNVSPSLQVTNDTTNTRVTVRGVGTLSNNEAQDQSIAVNIDGEYINRPTILNAAIFDLDRVEVLRGPQGTLYGRNSTGGAINFIARKPGDQFAVNASASYGNYNQVIVEGGVDLPFADWGAIRIAGIYSDHKGYNFHPNTPLSLPQFQARDEDRSGDDHTWGGRASIRLDPAAGLTINAAVEHIEQDLIPAAQAFVSFNDPGNGPGADCSQNGFVQVGPNTPGVQCVPQNTNFLKNVNRSTYNSPLTGVGILHQDSTAVRGRVAYDFGAATLTYTGGYRYTKNSGENTLSTAYDFYNFGASVKTQSHELRLNGMFSGITWQTGVFYFRELQDTNQGLYQPFIGPNGSYVTYFKHPTDTKSYSAFGQIEVPLADKLTAVGGLRYTKDKRDARFSNFGFVFNSGHTPIEGEAANPQILSSRDHKLSYLAGLNYKPDSNTLVYAKVSTGFKSGGFDGTGATFKPETNTAYEGGLKLNFGESKRNIFNVSGFYYDYKDLQNDALLDPTKGAQTFNAGKATIYGVEAETTIRLSQYDTFTASFNYLHAKYDQFVASYSVVDVTNPGNTSLVVADNPDLSGNRLPQTPKFVIGVGYDHIFDLGSAGTITAKAYSRFKSDYYLDFFNYRDSRQTAYTQTDLSLEYKPDNGRFGVQAYVRNVENYRPLAFAGFTSAGPDDVFNWQFAPPRTYGVRLSVDF